MRSDPEGLSTLMFKRGGGTRVQTMKTYKLFIFRRTVWTVSYVPLLVFIYVSFVSLYFFFFNGVLFFLDIFSFI